MISINLANTWHIKPIVSYRFLEKPFVDEFFEKGKIRLSSFKKFREHKDEIRGDGTEGSGFYLANYAPEDGSGHHMAAQMNTGKNAFVLCTTFSDTKSTFSDCAYDSGFRINDVTSFATEISRCIPSFNAGMQGQCFYKQPPIIDINVGEFNIDDLTEREVQGKWNEFFSLVNADNDIFFIKSEAFKSQQEYRLLWFVDEDGNEVEYLDIVCPRAIKYCSRL